MAKRRIVAVAAMIATALVGLFATPAAAARHPMMGPYDGICDNYEICLYYNSNWQGSVADFASSVPDFAGKVFKGPGAGKGQGVKNNAASACNYNPNYVAVVYFNSWYSGRADVIPPGECENLLITYNENASVKWAPL
ncbi:peptidase inhibitor family I36 protein [Actinophytocola gossypii]|uniref:Peptidase inhibitor family I36 protein n=1 Tax=Actinophytocola gossypii TaxID=2812003 RepID=A0ABT2JHZ5_9PSEU|nr:peptidase inhibitor family I36 protein [Actinophytocola gossypii]MCT2587020.1 peptidase inhibitor family I36 protein [Actinophytocola gossypii]